VSPLADTVRPAATQHPQAVAAAFLLRERARGAAPPFAAYLGIAAPPRLPTHPLALRLLVLQHAQHEPFIEQVRPLPGCSYAAGSCTPSSSSLLILTPAGSFMVQRSTVQYSTVYCVSSSVLSCLAAGEASSSAGCTWTTKLLAQQQGGATQEHRGHGVHPGQEVHPGRR